MPEGERAIASAAVIRAGTISEWTRASRIRRAIRRAYCAQIHHQYIVGGSGQPISTCSDRKAPLPSVKKDGAIATSAFWNSEMLE